MNTLNRQAPLILLFAAAFAVTGVIYRGNVEGQRAMNQIQTFQRSTDAETQRVRAEFRAKNQAIQNRLDEIYVALQPTSRPTTGETK